MVALDEKTGSVINNEEKVEAGNNKVAHIEILAKEIGTDLTYTDETVWKNLIFFLILHILAIWALGILITGGIRLKTFLWAIFVGYNASAGITMGAHRLFSHKSFKAKPVLKAILILAQTIAGQNCLFIWARDHHRLHHRYSDTDADPHNSKRGFFFSHIGWLMKMPLVIELGRRVDLSDLQADWIVMFQMKTLQPVESWFVSWISLGEGWHNYHHLFPWDYKAAEWGMHFNLTATWIRFCERIGWAYDLKTASPEMVKNRILTKGDGTHYIFGNDEARSAVTAKKYLGGLHPLNPVYNVTYVDM